MRAILTVTLAVAICVGCASATVLKVPKKEKVVDAEQQLGDQPPTTPCIQWEPSTSGHGIRDIHKYVISAQSWVIGSEDCDTCDVWGDVLPCFAVDYGVNVFGHRDYNYNWIWRDYCRISVRGGTYFSNSMFLPRKGPKWQTLTWQTVSVGDVVPDNTVRYKDFVLARTLNAPSGCCAGQGFSGYATITSNYTLTGVHFAVYNYKFTGSQFQVAICDSYHPPTPKPTTLPPPTQVPTMTMAPTMPTTAAPTTPVPIPTLPPTPVPPPPPPPTPMPTPSPDGRVAYVTRTTCVMGCDYTCTTYLYVVGQCVNELRGSSTLYLNNGGQLEIKQFAGPGCVGSTTSDVVQPVQQCYQLPDYTYVQNAFYNMHPSTSGVQVTHTSCVEGCDYECTTNTTTTGLSNCVMGTTSPTTYSCYSDFVGVTTYFANDCTSVTNSTLSITIVYANGQCLPTGQNGGYHTYSCTPQ